MIRIKKNPPQQLSNHHRPANGVYSARAIGHICAFKLVWRDYLNHKKIAGLGDSMDI